MSGGSWGYLYQHSSVAEDYADTFEEMSKRLRGAGLFAQADRAGEISTLLKRAHELWSASEDMLWAVEWRDSGDIGDERFAEEMEKWEATNVWTEE